MVDYSYDIFSSLLKNRTYTYPFKMTEYTDHLNWKNPQAYIQFEIDKSNSWIKKYRLKTGMIISYTGWCHSFNLVEYDKMFHKNSTSEYFDIFHDKILLLRSKNYYQNMTEHSPFYTTRKEYGFDFGFVVNRNYYADQYSGIEHWMYNNWQVKVIVHSSFEMPDVRHRSFDVNIQELFKIFFVVQIKITDSTLLDLDADE